MAHVFYSTLLPQDVSRLLGNNHKHVHNSQMNQKQKKLCNSSKWLNTSYFQELKYFTALLLTSPGLSQCAIKMSLQGCQFEIKNECVSNELAP